MSTLFLQSDATRIPLPDGSVDLVFTSPPYLDARTYGIAAQRGCTPWIEWMLEVVAECTRVCRGLVLVNCAGVTRQRCYQPGPEGLLYEWWKRGGHCWRPAYWHRVGIPGSGGKQWLRADIEYVLAFKRDAEWLEWSDNTANGHPPKWAPGGEMSHRLSSGARVNQWGPVGSGRGRRRDGTRKPQGSPSHVELSVRDYRKQMLADGEFPPGAHLIRMPGDRREHSKRLADGKMETQVYLPPVKANPGVLVKTTVGGGHLGHPLAHENEAPFPEALAEWFIKGWCKPGGIVLDPFSGSGTTACVADRLGRHGIGCDLRFSQCELGRKRYLNPVARKTRKPKPQAKASEHTLFAEVA